MLAGLASREALGEPELRISRRSMAGRGLVALAWGAIRVRGAGGWSGIPGPASAPRGSGGPPGGYGRGEKRGHQPQTARRAKAGLTAGAQVTNGPAAACPAGHTVATVDTSTVIASSPVELTVRLAALADPVRLRIVGVLAGGGRCVCDLQEKVPVAANLLSYHLRVLRDAGLVVAARRGRWIDYRLDGEGFAALWAQASAAGVPLPGDRVITGRRGSPCENDGEGVCGD